LKELCSESQDSKKLDKNFLITVKIALISYDNLKMHENMLIVVSLPFYLIIVTMFLMNGNAFNLYFEKNIN
jgi:hypothetical protein